MSGTDARSQPGAARATVLRYALGTLLAFGALNAFGGGSYGMSGAKDVPTAWLEGTPFRSYFVPSLILFAVVGGSCLVAAVAVFARWRLARTAAFAAGAILVGWIVVQVAMIGFVSWLQPTTFAGGLAVLALARHGNRRTSFLAEYERDVRAGLLRQGTAGPRDAPLVGEADLAALPPPVQRYLRYAGAVGQPRVRNYRVRFRGRIRASAESRWMPFVADQQSFVDEPTRLFWMRARMLGAPVQALHRLTGGHATMRVRALGAFTIVDAAGPVMDRSEAVTLFNDMCILAPATLLEPSVAWEGSDAHRARARFTNGAETIRATLVFADDGRLVDFISDDRARASADGKRFTPLRFSTPVSDYRAFGPFRIAAHGEARWHAPAGEFTYGEFELIDLAYNVSATSLR